MDLPPALTKKVVFVRELSRFSNDLKNSSKPGLQSLSKRSQVKDVSNSLTVRSKEKESR